MEILEICDENTRIRLIAAGFGARKEKAPGEKAKSDDQGMELSCTLHALSKAITDGCENKVFFRTMKIDLKQDDVTEELKIRMKDFFGKDLSTEGTWPEKLWGQGFEFEDQQSHELWFLRLYVEEKNLKDFVAQIEMKYPNYTHVLVYEIKPGTTNPKRHTVYAEEIQTNKKGANEIRCINSYPELPIVMIDLNREGNKFYRIFCEATKMIPVIQSSTLKNEEYENILINDSSINQSDGEHMTLSKTKQSRGEKVKNRLIKMFREGDIDILSSTSLHELDLEIDNVRKHPKKKIHLF